MSSSLMELWTALNSCLWSCVMQSAAEEVILDGRTFRVIRLVGAAYARWIGTNLLQLIAARTHRSSRRKCDCCAQLAEGGYSFVYLVRELPTAENLNARTRYFALKKVRLPL